LNITIIGVGYVGLVTGVWQDMLFIATEWEEFKVLRLKTIAKLMKNPAVFDGRNCFSLEEAKESMVDYYSIGRPAVIKSSSLI
jgi:UDPglucose 6-dehydrogenase